MWLPNLGLSFSLLGLVYQSPLTPPSLPATTMVVNSTKDFDFKEGPDVFSPKDSVLLARPGAGVANPAGDLVLVSVNKYSLEDKKYVHC